MNKTLGDSTSVLVHDSKVWKTRDLVTEVQAEGVGIPLTEALLDSFRNDTDTPTRIPPRRAWAVEEILRHPHRIVCHHVSQTEMFL